MTIEPAGTARPGAQGAQTGQTRVIVASSLGTLLRREAQRQRQANVILQQYSALAPLERHLELFLAMYIKHPGDLC